MSNMSRLATSQKLADLANGAPAATPTTGETQVLSPAEIAVEEQFFTEAERRFPAWIKFCQLEKGVGSGA